MVERWKEVERRKHDREKERESESEREEGREGGRKGEGRGLKLAQGFIDSSAWPRNCAAWCF